MTHHIKCALFFTFLLFLSCSGNTLIEERKVEEKLAVFEDRQAISSFTFLKAFQFCDNPYAALTSKEAEELYQNKTITLELSNDKPPVDCDAFFFEGAKQCIETQLAENCITSVLLSTEDSFPFEKVVLFNEKYLVTAQDGFFFTFQVSNREFGNDDSNAQENHGIIGSKSNLMPIFKALKAKPSLDLPVEYSYELIMDLEGFTRMDQDPNMKNLDHLESFQFARLPSKGRVRLLLVAGMMESGQSELYLLSADNDFNRIDYILLYSSQETDDGNISTYFRIDKNHEITITKEESVDGLSTVILDQRKNRIDSGGYFVKVK